MDPDGLNVTAGMTLKACPLCRTNLPGESAQLDICPGCGASLEVFRGYASLTRRYLGLAREYLGRGMAEDARKIIEQLPMIGEIDAEELTGLRAQLALLEGELAQARKFAGELPPAVAQTILAAADELAAQQLRSNELYNFALSSARRGEYRSAAVYLRQAIALGPANARCWQLKLKVDLKLNDWVACYLDLKRLDELAGRPIEFSRLEELLPPVAS